MTPVELPPRERVSAMVRAALEEDAAAADATAAFLDLGRGAVRTEVRGAADMVVCGTGVAREVFRQVDGSIEFEAAVEDGARAGVGAVLARVSGPARAIVSAERTALNFLQRMSGVATLAARYVEAVAGTGVTILDTRKTVPLWRELDKYAVRCGGARNHRRDLGAMVLIKENHVRAAGGRGAVLARIAGAAGRVFVELEVDSAAFLDDVLGSPALGRIDRIMLDNFTPALVRAAVSRIEAARRLRADRCPQVEVSGGVTLETVGAYAFPGVDFISVGAITHSAPAAPMSLEIV